MISDYIAYFIAFSFCGVAAYWFFRYRKAQEELVAARADLERCQLTLEISEDVGRFGSWHLDARTNVVKWSDYVFDMHERPRSFGNPPLEDAIHYYHPDDRSLVQTAVARSLEECVDFEFRARILTESGNELPVLARGTCQLGGDGDVLGIFGCFVDMSTVEERTIN